MRIAYISLHWPRSLSSSVGKKIGNQIRVWRNLGHTVQFFSHLHSPHTDEKLVEGQRFYYQNDKGLLSSEWDRITAAGKLLESVRIYQPDVVYFRWGMYVHPMKRVFKIAPTVIEINTNDYEEHKLLGFSRDQYNQVTRSILLGNAVGHVFTSKELSKDPVFTKFDKPYTVITNGIDLEKTPFYPAPDNTHPHLIFIGTPGMAWHGVEKLVWHGVEKLVLFAQRFPDIKIDIVGYKSFNDTSDIPSNMVFHGYQRGTQYENLLSSADAAIGTLSLHLNGMQEASPFKIRDCAARGIPCILPYKDTDLYDLDCRELLNIPNTPDNTTTHGVEIHDFVERMRGKRLERSLVESRIDIIQKEKTRLDFFNLIFHQNGG
jgi:glycosyltransferase involved in cell wall biosynthesis